MACHKHTKRIKGSISNSSIGLARIGCDQKDLAKVFCHFDYLTLHEKFYYKEKVQEHSFEIDENTVNCNLYLEHL